MLIWCLLLCLCTFSDWLEHLCCYVQHHAINTSGIQHLWWCKINAFACHMWIAPADQQTTFIWKNDKHTIDGQCWINFSTACLKGIIFTLNDHGMITNNVQRIHLENNKRHCINTLNIFYWFHVDVFILFCLFAS